MTITRSAKKFKRVARDSYPTHEKVVEALFDAVGSYGLKFRKTICDPCCGRKRKVLAAVERRGHLGVGGDIVYGYDFIANKFPLDWTNSDIITNPPYGDRRASLAQAFVRRALEVVRPWRGRVAMLLPADFDSGVTRQDIFGHQAFAATVVLTNRVRIFRNKSGTTNHSWFVWDWRRRPGPSIKLYSHINYED